MLRQRQLCFYFDFSRLSDSERLAWVELVEVVKLALGCCVSLYAFSDIIPKENDDFVFVSSSTSLTRNLLLNFSNFYILPVSGVAGVDPFFWGRHAGLRSSRYNAGEVDISLISSIYCGDVYLSGFLANAAALKGYEKCEHLLIRAGSTGDEQGALIDHVRRHPNTVYINLKTDPGLYDVWNLGMRLATGRYLSNANLDDRRSPMHLRRMVALLDENRDIDVVSSALRVTTKNNLRWEDSEYCQVWPEGIATGYYSASSLFRQLGAGLASRNLPHCMPLWRRTLAGWVGDFDEALYGPSADWAYWLRAATRGAGFYFDATPLGLYLKDDNSYWRRHSAAGAISPHDAAIVAAYGALAAGDSEVPEAVRRPLSLELAMLENRISAGACLDALTYLLVLWSDLSGSLSERARSLLLRFGQRHFGSGFTAEFFARFVALVIQDRHLALFCALVDLVHSSAFEAGGEILRGRVGRGLSLAAVDWLECYRDPRGMLLLAFIAGRGGDGAREQALLKRMHDADPSAFWRGIQDVYRFTRPLRELCADSGRAECRQLADDRQPRRIANFPDYRGNAYLGLLYVGESDVVPVNTLEDIVSLLPALSAANILHVHWVNAVAAGVKSAALIGPRMDAFLQALEDRKRQGFSVFWTIHNYLSHECLDRPAELAFRRKLYALADRVFIHHPLAAHLLDWLPDWNKLCLSEHGAYPVKGDVALQRLSRRTALGFSDDDFVLMHVGRVRAYKGLAEWLPALLEMLRGNPRLRFVLVGKIGTEEIRAWLDSHPHPQMQVIDSHVSDAELQALMVAADLGLLSYDATLTSGTLFHWLSVGCPVLAPDKGTIPCYVVDSWNGFRYCSVADAARVINGLAGKPAEVLRLGRNAAATAAQLHWGLWV